MIVKLKKLNPNAKVPTYAHASDAGMDLYAVTHEYDAKKDNHVYGTGIALEIPKGFVGLVFPRSSNRNTMAFMTNCVGVIDSGYRGEIYCTFKNRDNFEFSSPYSIGDRIAQLIIMPYPSIEFLEVDELAESDRGSNGHGSTGK